MRHGWCNIVTTIFLFSNGCVNFKDYVLFYSVLNLLRSNVRRNPVSRSTLSHTVIWRSQGEINVITTSPWLGRNAGSRPSSSQCVLCSTAVQILVNHDYRHLIIMWQGPMVLTMTFTGDLKLTLCTNQNKKLEASLYSPHRHISKQFDYFNIHSSYGRGGCTILNFHNPISTITHIELISHITQNTANNLMF